MGKGKKEHKHSSNKIRAKNKLFVNSNFEKSYNNVNTSGSVLCHDDLDIFRKNEKSTVADIERYASNFIKPNLKISDESVDIIKANYSHANPYVNGFIVCIISCYNKTHTSSTFINLSAMYKSKNRYKIMQQAEKNCERTITAYVNKIIAKMKSGQWKNVTKYDIAKFEAIEPAVLFFCAYIDFLTIGTIPEKISNQDYVSAINYDPKIVRYYSKDMKDNCYKLNKKANNKINNFNQKCLTFLFCKYIKEKK